MNFCERIDSKGLARVGYFKGETQGLMDWTMDGKLIIPLIYLIPFDVGEPTL